MAYFLTIEQQQQDDAHGDAGIGKVEHRTEEDELLVYGIDNGQYKTVLTSLTTDSSVSIRISDAILLSTFSDIPLYIDNHLLLLQSSRYTPHTSGLVIPINTISLEHLEKELQKAVAEENYRLASSIYDEIKKRKQ